MTGKRTSELHREGGQFVARHYLQRRGMVCVCHIRRRVVSVGGARIGTSRHVKGEVLLWLADCES